MSALAARRAGGLAHYLMRDAIRGATPRADLRQPQALVRLSRNANAAGILRPKILCKDIGEKPQFWVDRSGQIVPRHSVYYIVPQ